MKSFFVLAACALSVSLWVPTQSSAALTDDDSPVYGIGEGRSEWGILCPAGPNVWHAPSPEVDACAQACAADNDPEAWRAYQYYCFEANPYDRQACKDAIRAINAGGCHDKCCPKPATQSYEDFV